MTDTKCLADTISEMFHSEVQRDIPFKHIINWYDEDPSNVVDLYVVEMRIAIIFNAVTHSVRDAFQAAGIYLLHMTAPKYAVQRLQEFMTTVWWKQIHEKAEFHSPKLFGDVGHDLAVVQGYRIEPKQHQMLSTGIQIQLPPNLYGWITPRSSMARRLLLIANGIIDAGYRGELAIPVFNMTDTLIEIEQGERVAQIIFQSRIPIHVLKTKNFNYPTERKANGFGSTGKR